MKNLKNLLPLFALILGLTIVFTQSAFTSPSKTHAKQTSMFWYNVVDDHTVGSAIFEGEKIDALEETTCQDDPEQEICLYGSVTELNEPTEVQSPSSANTILKTEE